MTANVPTARFVLNEADASAALEQTVADDAGPYLSDEEPARSIEQLVYDLGEHIDPPDGYDRYGLFVHPLIFDADPDGVLIVLSPMRGIPYLAAPMVDWDDLAPRSAIGGSLTPDQAIGVVNAVLAIANDLLAADAATAQAHPGR